MTGPFLAGSDKSAFHKPSFTGKNSPLVSPVPGHPSVRTNKVGVPLEKMKLSTKAKRHAVHTM